MELSSYTIEERTLCQESPAYPVITHFEEDKKPIFVVYGHVPYFPDVINGFRHHFQQQAAGFYFPLDMAKNKRETPGETFFEIVRQIVDLLLDRLPDPEEQRRLFSSFRLLTNLKEKTRRYEPDEQLAEFVRFSSYSCYPIVGKMFSQHKHFIIIEFKRFETVINWSRKIHNYILDGLLQSSKGGNLRFVLFVQSDQKPSLFYGSDEESSRDNVAFHQLKTATERSEPIVPHQYLA